MALQIRVKALQTDGMNIDRLKAKAQEMWDQIVKLETEKYDLEERSKRQDYDVSKRGLIFCEVRQIYFDKIKSRFENYILR